jgi:Domain of unknown function (DUF3291)
MTNYHLAQVNIGRVKAPIEDLLMAGFVARLDEINALAEHSPGFVWRLQTSQGNATYFRPYPNDDRILINMSVWETVEALRHYVYQTAMLNFSASGNRGLKNSQESTWRYGGFQRDTVRARMRRRNASPIWKNMAPRNSPSLSNSCSNRMRNFSVGSTGPRLHPAQRPDFGRRQAVYHGSKSVWYPRFAENHCT